MQMIKRRKDDTSMLGDFPIWRRHMGDDSGVILDDMAVAIDDSGGNLTPHFYIPPAEIKNQTLGWCLMLVACSAVKVPHVIREPLVCSEQ